MSLNTQPDLCWLGCKGVSYNFAEKRTEEKCLIHYFLRLILFFFLTSKYTNLRAKIIFQQSSFAIAILMI